MGFYDIISVTQILFASFFKIPHFLQHIAITEAWLFEKPITNFS